MLTFILNSREIEIYFFDFSFYINIMKLCKWYELLKTFFFFNINKIICKRFIIITNINLVLLIKVHIFFLQFFFSYFIFLFNKPIHIYTVFITFLKK
jgi:hypothetical protein